MPVFVIFGSTSSQRKVNFMKAMKSYLSLYARNYLIIFMLLGEPSQTGLYFLPIPLKMSVSIDTDKVNVSFGDSKVS